MRHALFVAGLVVWTTYASELETSPRRSASCSSSAASPRKCSVVTQRNLVVLLILLLLDRCEQRPLVLGLPSLLLSLLPSQFPGIAVRARRRLVAHRRRLQWCELLWFVGLRVW